MLGAIMIALGITAFTVEGIRNDFRNSESKERAIREGREWYVDHKGKTKCLRDNKPAVLTTMRINGSDHKVLKYVGSNVIAADITQKRFDELSKKSYEWAKKIGASVYLYEDTNHCEKENDIPGSKVKDIKTGDIYVLRAYGFLGTVYYVNIKTGELVRPADSEIIDFNWVKKVNFNYKKSRTITVFEMRRFIEYRNQAKDTKERIQKNIFGRSDSRSYDFLNMLHNKPDRTIEKMQECGMTRIYEEGETWESKSKEFEDVGSLYDYTKEPLGRRY